MKRLDVGDLDALMAAANDSGLPRLLGLEAYEIGPGRTKARMTITEKHLNLMEATHGAALYALADHVCSLAGNSLGRRAVMTQSSTYFFANPELGDEITAEARVKSAGRRLGYLEVEVADARGRLLLRFDASFYFLDRGPQ